MPSTVSFLLEKNDENMFEDEKNENHQRSIILTRQMVSFDDDDDTRKKPRTKQIKSDKQGEATLLEEEEEEDENNLFSPDELEVNPRTKQNIISSPVRTSSLPSRRIKSKIPLQSNSSLRTKSTNQGVFQYFQSSTQSPLLMKDDRQRLETSDEDFDTANLKENDLKLKLKEEKRQGKLTGELLTKLHENYEELLEKYAQAENTIDQLRFQPKFSDENTPRSNTAELIHITQPSKQNMATLRSSGIYRSTTTGSPLSSIRPVPSTTTTTPARKSVSPSNSSIVFDETTPKKTIEQLKNVLFIETKTLKDKMKSFLTLMDANQLSLAEQKQVYETIKQDYEKLVQFGRENRDDFDFNQELETMKNLLKDIVKKITDNLLGKSRTDSSPERQTQDGSRSSQLSMRSSLCNHNELMDQYEKLLNAVNTPIQDPFKSVLDKIEHDSKFDRSKKVKAYVYSSGNSDNDQSSNTSVPPIPPTKTVQSISFELDHIPSKSVKTHQSKIQIRTSSKPVYLNNRTNDYDSGIGLTKLSHDSKLYTSTMDESHFQSLNDDEDSISSSNNSISTSSRSPSSKKFNQHTKPIVLSNSYQTQLETNRTTRSFRIQPQISSYKKSMHRSNHTWRPQKTSSSHRTRLTPIYRSTSIATPVIEDCSIKSHRSLNTPSISTKIRNESKVPSSYRSSIYINETHPEKEDFDSHLYLDPHTGIVYRYESSKIKNMPRIYYPTTSSSTKKLYRCKICGTMTTYHHRHHTEPILRRIPTISDDLGYESGQKKRHRHYRYIDYTSSSSSSSSSSSLSSDSDSDFSDSYYEVMALNQAYQRAEQVQHHSRCLSRYILRQLKLALVT